MPITITPAADAIKGGYDTREYTYIITGTDDEEDVIALAPGSRYITVNDPYGTVLLLKKSVSYEEIIYDPDNLDLCTWKVTVNYGLYETLYSDEDNIVNYRFNISTTNVHTKTAIENSAPIYAPDTTFRFDDTVSGLIGILPQVDGSITAEGCDIIVPILSLEVTCRYNFDTWKDKIEQLSHKTGMVNSGKFLWYDAEEVLFCGASLDIAMKNIATSYIDATLSFQITPSTWVDIPGITTETNKIKKIGWRYLWTYDLPTSDGKLAKSVAAKQSRVYLKTSFDDLLPDVPAVP